MRYTIVEAQGKRITLGFEEDLTNEGNVCIHELEIDGVDCTPALAFGNLTEVFEYLILKQK